MTDRRADAAVLLCRHCDARFLRASYLSLHQGHAHAVQLSRAEAEAYHAAVDAEDKVLLNLRRHVRASLVVLPFALFYFWAIVALMQAGGNFGLAALPLPGVLGFGALVYYLVLTRDQAKGPGGPEGLASDADKP